MPKIITRTIKTREDQKFITLKRRFHMYCAARCVALRVKVLAESSVDWLTLATQRIAQRSVAHVETTLK